MINTYQVKKGYRTTKVNILLFQDYYIFFNVTFYYFENYLGLTEDKFVMTGTRGEL